MKIFLINLDRDKHRLLSADEQLRRCGVTYERFSAIYAPELSKDVKKQVVNRFRWWCAIGLPARDAEIGCAMSHYGIYKQMVASKESTVCCVLEDDVILTDGFSKALSDVESWIGNETPRVVLLSDRTGLFAGVTTESAEIRRSLFAICADAYVLNSLAAEALLRENLPMQRPCDHWAHWTRRGAIELYHYLPTVASQNQEAFGSSTQGGLRPVHDYSLPHWIWHKFNRFIGKTIDKLLG